MLGDIFLVGFDIDLEKYKDFLRDTKIKNHNLAVLMLSGSVPRLRFGALIANFSIPFMLCSVYSLYTLAAPSVWAVPAVALIGIGFALSPVAHVAYYYVGTLCKSLFDEYRQRRTTKDTFCQGRFSRKFISEDSCYFRKNDI
jgi:hypothetical protein